MDQIPSLQVSWQLIAPQVSEASAHYTWPEMLAASADVAQNRALEQALHWPQMTLDVLWHAFEARLSRYTAWQFSHEHRCFEAIEAAAQVFRRGVSTNHSPAAESRGEYEISFHSAWQPSSQELTECFVVVDSELQKHWPKVASLDTSFSYTLHEQSKTLASVAQLQADWRQAGSKPHWLVIGGGILADTAAFAAGLVGCGFSLVPTTLLAMVDACVGGKTGVNFPPFGKNQLGLFRFPHEVIISAHWLQSLPKRQLQAGAYEALKHYLLCPQQQLADFFAHPPEMGSLEWLQALRALVEVKAKVVAQDPQEHGLRASLNLGHTLAHALEAVNHNQGRGDLLHGEAVGFGLMFATVLSQMLGQLPGDKAQHIYELLQQMGALRAQDLKNFLEAENLEDPELVEKLLAHIAQDKKIRPDSQAHSQWVLLQDLGQVTVENGSYTFGVTRLQLEQAWASFLKLLT